MPLLVSPIDNQTPMQQIVRDGIEIDRCPVSGGVWLDKGELEKLLGMIRSAVTEDEDDFQQFRQMKQSGHMPPASYQQQMPPHGYQRHYKYDDDDYADYHKHKHGKRNKLKSLFDMFD